MSDEFMAKMLGADTGTGFHAWVKPAANTEKAFVVLENDIPAGTYSPRDAALLGAAWTDSASKSEDMHAVIGWLLESGMPEEKVAAAVLGLQSKQNHEALMRALSPLVGKGMW